MIKLVERLVERINGLEARVEALETQRNKKIHNSGKPPFSDGFGKRSKRLQKKSYRSSGDNPVILAPPWTVA